MKPLDSSDRKRIIKQLEEQYGIREFPYIMLKFGKEKIRIYSGGLSREELRELDKNLRIENIGLYFAKEQNGELRLTLDGVQILKNQINKNVIEVSDSDSERWFKGEELPIKADSSFKILKNKGDIIGIGKSTGEKITNFLPKERRMR